MKPSPIAVLGALLGSLTLGSLVLGAPSALAATASPTVLSASATPGALGPAGGQVLVSGTVDNAATCRLVLLSHQSFPVVYSHNPTTACQDGSFSANVTIGANPSAVKRTVAFALVARNGAYQFTGRFYVALEPVLVPSVLSARATPSALGPAGGQVVASGTVRNAATCQLVLVVAPVLPRRLLAQPDNGVPRRELLGPGHHRGQPERHGTHVSPSPSSPATGGTRPQGASTSCSSRCWSRASYRPAPRRAPSGQRAARWSRAARSRTPATCQLVLVVAPVLPRRLLAQPDHGVPRRELLGARHHRGQPERRKAHGRLRPGGPQRDLHVHRVLLRVAWRPARADALSAASAHVPPAPARYPAGATGYDVSWPQCTSTDLGADQAASRRPRHMRSSGSTTGPSGP